MKTFSSLLAQLNYEIWYYDDLREFKKLRKSSERLFKNIGYRNANKIAKHIASAYEIYAELDDALVENRNDLKRNCKTFLGIEREIYLGIKAADDNSLKAFATHHTNWWFFFLKKKNESNLFEKINDYFNIIYFIYVQHRVKYSIIESLCLTAALFLAGLLGHNLKSKRVAEFFLRIYWKQLLKLGKSPFMF